MRKICVVNEDGADFNWNVSYFKHIMSRSIDKWYCKKKIKEKYLDSVTTTDRAAFALVDALKFVLLFCGSHKLFPLSLPQHSYRTLLLPIHRSFVVVVVIAYGKFSLNNSQGRGCARNWRHSHSVDRTPKSLNNQTLCRLDSKGATLPLQLLPLDGGNFLWQFLRTWGSKSDFSFASDRGNSCADRMVAIFAFQWIYAEPWYLVLPLLCGVTCTTVARN